MENDNSKSEYKDPFLQRAIEHWLDSSNELGYQPLFCEWLTVNGYVLKYSIKNTHFEQGKDVVAVSSEGDPYAFQLKGGSINLKRWRDEVKPEIDILIGGAIQHPDIDKNKKHVSYLVTNGEIEDNVRSEIVSLNEGVWKENQLHVWTRGDLLSGFQKMAEGIFPKDALTYKKIIELIFADGTGFPELQKIYFFLKDILQIDSQLTNKSQIKRNVAGALLYTIMIAGPYRQSKNYASVVRIMVVLLSLIFYIVDKNSLDDKYWFRSYEIVWRDILLTSKMLENEINTEGFDKSLVSPLDIDLILFRKHSAVSIVYPFKLSQVISKDEDWKSMFLPEIAKKYRGSISIWGEASLVPFIILALIFRDVPNVGSSAIRMLENAISNILAFNGRKSKNKIGLIPPYYDLDFAVKLAFGLLEEEFDGNYKLSSYMIKPILDILIRLGQRDFIADNWQEISHMRFEELIPEDKNDYYLWRIEKGENRSILPKKEQSWSELVSKANSYDGSSLPETLKRFPEFLPFFISVYPFRVNSDVVGFLQKVSSKQET